MLPRKPWGIEGAARLCLGIVATFCLGMVFAGLLGKLKLPDAEIEFLQMMTGLLFLQGAALVWITFFLRQNGTGWREAFGLGLSDPVTAVAYGILAGALFLPAALILQWASGVLMQLVHLTPEVQVAVKELQDPSLSLGEKLLFGAAAIILAPVAEETIFRGILYPAIKQKGFPRLALWGTSGAFAIMHGNVASLLPLVVFAVALVYLYETFGNLLAPIAAHSLFNTANFLILMFQDRIDRVLHLS